MTQAKQQTNKVVEQHTVALKDKGKMEDAGGQSSTLDDKAQAELETLNARISTPEAIADADGTIERERKLIYERSIKAAEALKTRKEELKRVKQQIADVKSRQDLFNTHGPALKASMPEILEQVAGIRSVVNNAATDLKTKFELEVEAPSDKHSGVAANGAEYHVPAKSSTAQSANKSVSDGESDSEDEDDMAWIYAALSKSGGIKQDEEEG